jgi:hypothetical protein
MYRRTPLSSGFSLSELLNGRQIRTKIDTLIPSPAHIAQRKQSVEDTKSQLMNNDSSVNKVEYKYNIGDPCPALYCGPGRDKDPRWISAIIHRKFGSRFMNVSASKRTHLAQAC